VTTPNFVVVPPISIPTEYSFFIFVCKELM
jgi:hypothetical protein